ncbi:branched chain amino acid aminotransferase [Chitinophagaceae bacterium IBVUCB1]|nr:branched chain amino acid aminotransferase [Chitinophagaceae bacterium IBVUCB1]
MEYAISILPQAERTVKDTTTIPFGVQPTEHMFVAEYKNGQWHNSRIVPYSNLTMSPFALCLHYGQTVFEGMKAFLMNDGRINIFRTDKHYERFAKSLERMCMPVVPQALFTEALHQLVQLDGSWVPDTEHGSLYLRPFMIASEERLGVKIADEYLFMIVCTPAYQYYTQPLKVRVEETYARAADGGTGYAKCGGNYGGAYYPTKLAREAGYDQVIWTDSKTHEMIEESGTMNLMFFIDDTLITPPLSGTILDGVTRDSLLTLAREMDIATDVRPIGYKEIEQALQTSKRVEAFGAGTAAVIAPIQTIAIKGRDYDCYIGDDATMYKLQRALYDVRKGTATDNHNWNYII